MAVRVKVDGATLVFPDGISDEAIAQAIDEFVAEEKGFDLSAGNIMEELGRIGVTASAKMSDWAKSINPIATEAAALGKVGGQGWYDAPATETLKEYAPETAAGKVAADVIPGLVLGGVGGFAGSAIARPVTMAVRSRAGQWAADGFASSVGAQLLTNADVDLRTTAIDTAGNMALNAILPGLGTTLKGILRGNQEGQVLEAATRTGVQPTRAMLTNGAIARTTEKHLENTLGSSGIMAKLNEQNNDALNEFTDRLTRAMAVGKREGDNLYGVAPTLEPVALGDELAAAYGSFATKTSQNAQKYFEVAISRAGKYRIRMTETLKTLKAIEMVVEDNPGLKAILQSGDISTLVKGIREQAGKGVTLDGAIKLKAAIRNMQVNPGKGLKQASDAELGRIARALEDDIQSGLRSNNSPFGVQGAYNEANKAWGKRMDDLASLGVAFNRGDDGMALYSRLFGSPQNALTLGNLDNLRAVLTVMPQRIQNQVTAELIRRAGLEAAGQAGNAGQKFSAASFMTNYNKLKASGILGLIDGQHADDLEALALISSRLKDLGRAANFSNTGVHLNAANMMQGMTALASGGTSLPVSMAFANLSARFLTNPQGARALVDIANRLQNRSPLAEALIRAWMVAEEYPELAPDVEALIDDLASAN
ncbi:UNVERIFIED_ORG: hypothetical protein J2Y78_002044 [Buttiauxella agrestis ATCC 33320]